MKEQPEADRPAVDAAEYDEAYFLCASEGYREFAASRGRRLGSRFRKALSLADVQPGQRVLDIGCGRGELVMHCARLGAFAAGIDYSETAVAIAREGLASHPPGVQERAAFALMDGRHLAFADASFDTALMTDVVEHLYPEELMNVLRETRTVLKPGGRLVVHTSPNRILLDTVYPQYVRRIHQAVAFLSRLSGRQDPVFTWLLPVAPRFPRSPYERATHVNEQSGPGLAQALTKAGYRVTHVGYWEPPHNCAYCRRYAIRLLLLDTVRYLRPFSYVWPLNILFSNHIWAVACRP
jgi:ubiquinone/menaquinone biosynthesis C-methylase UbiE